MRRPSRSRSIGPASEPSAVMDAVCPCRAALLTRAGCTAAIDAANGSRSVTGGGGLIPTRLGLLRPLTSRPGHIRQRSLASAGGTRATRGTPPPGGASLVNRRGLRWRSRRRGTAPKAPPPRERPGCLFQLGKTHLVGRVRPHPVDQLVLPAVVRSPERRAVRIDQTSCIPRTARPDAMTSAVTFDPIRCRRLVRNLSRVARDR